MAVPSWTTRQSLTESQTVADIRATAARALQRQSLLAYTKALTYGYRAGWVHAEVAAHMEAFSRAVAAQSAPRLILTMPPRHGKSRLSECLSAWHLGHHPRHEVIVASYALTPAQDRTRAARELILAPDTQAAFPHLQLSPDTASKTDWRLCIEGRQAGGVYAAGVRGSLTSRGAHLLVIDDPVKDWEDAQSPAQRAKTWDWYTSTAVTRVAPGGGILVIQTRWHEDDLTGRILEHAAHEGWIVVNFPAIAEGDEHSTLTGQLLRRAGQALHPARYPLSALEQIRATLGATQWSALYQQRPTTPGGEIWRRGWFRHYQAPPTFDETIISADLSAGSTSGDASYPVIQAWGRKGADLYLLEEWRRRCDYPSQRAALVAMVAAHSPRKVLIEDAAHGKALIQELRGSISQITPVPAQGSKISRAHAAAASIEQGRVWLPDSAREPWVRDWLAEVTTFPAAANDDRVDAAGQAIRAILQARQPSLLAGVRV